MERLPYLFERCLSGNATDEEHAELLQLLQAPENEERARSFLRQSFMGPVAPVHLSPETSTSIIKAITNVNKGPNHQAAPGVPEGDERSAIRRILPAGNENRALLWRRALAVAAVLLLMAAATWLFVLPKANHPAPAQTIAKIPQPGGNKAVLTLDNGARIVLDSASNGTIAAQGNAQVVKLASGQLAYQALAGPRGRAVYNTMVTPRGGGYRLALPDGSRVWLNSASSIRFPTSFSDSERRVEITGEAYFEVSKNDKAPFIVETRGMKIEVLGTEFNLMAYNDEDAIRTTLVTGAVSVHKGAEKNILRPGQQASLANGWDVFRIGQADLEETLAWKEGKFRFSKSDIKVIMRQIARWYDVDIVYKGTLPDIEFSGVFPRKEYISQLLEVLEDAVKVHFDTEGNTITVTAAK